MWYQERNEYNSLSYALGDHPPALAPIIHAYPHAPTQPPIPAEPSYGREMVPGAWPSLPPAPPGIHVSPLIVAHPYTVQAALSTLYPPHQWAGVPYVSPCQIGEPLYSLYSYPHGHSPWLPSQLVSPTATEISDPPSGASLYTSTLSPMGPETPVIKREVCDVQLTSPISPIATHRADPSTAYPTPVADETPSPTPSLADLLGPPAPKCQPLRTTGVSQDMKRMMGVFRLDPFAIHDGMHAATRACGVALVATIAERAAEAGEHGNRLRDHTVCWNGDVAGPHQYPSLFVEFQADLDDPDNLVPYQEQFPQLFPRDTPSPAQSPTVPLMLLGLDEGFPARGGSSTLSDLEYLRYPSPELEPRDTLVFRHPGCNAVS